MRWLVWLGIRMGMENGTRVGKQMADQTVERLDFQALQSERTIMDKSRKEIAYSS